GMKIEKINGIDYRLPGSLNSFRRSLYVHLIHRKWEKITKEAGYSKHKGQSVSYDAILPAAIAKDLSIIYRPIREELRRHHRKNPFRMHTFFNHMASSQA